jgi:drug/metabolite transporter (DMT)-like permease
MSRLQADLLLLVVALIWGSAFVAQNLGMANVGPYTFTAARFWLGALIVAPLAWREMRERGRAANETATLPDGRDLRLMAILGTLLFLGAAFQQIGIVSTTVTNAGFLTALYVPLVPLLAWLINRHRPHWSTWPAAIGCLLGSWLLTGGQTIAINSGDLWVVSSAIFWAGHILLLGQTAKHPIGPFTVACGQFLVVGILGTLVALIIEPPTLAKLTAAAGSIAYAGILSVGFAFTAQVIAQRHTMPADTAIIISSEMAFAAIFGAIWFGDKLDSGGILGCVLILCGSLLVQLLPLFETMRRIGKTPV